MGSLEKYIVVGATKQEVGMENYAVVSTDLYDTKVYYQGKQVDMIDRADAMNQNLEAGGSVLCT